MNLLINFKRSIKQQRFLPFCQFMTIFKRNEIIRFFVENFQIEFLFNLGNKPIRRSESSSGVSKSSLSGQGRLFTG